MVAILPRLSKTKSSLGLPIPRPARSCLSLVSCLLISPRGSQRKFPPSNTWKLMRWRQTVFEWPGIRSQLRRASTSWCGFRSMAGRLRRWVDWPTVKIDPERDPWKWMPTAEPRLLFVSKRMRTAWVASCRARHLAFQTHQIMLYSSMIKDVLLSGL